DAPQSTVFVSGVFMDTNLVTYGLWQQVATWAATNGYGFTAFPTGIAANYPATTMNWYDAVKWCNARSQQAGLPPVYFTNPAMTSVYKTGQGSNVYVNWSLNG